MTCTETKTKVFRAPRWTTKTNQRVAVLSDDLKNVEISIFNCLQLCCYSTRPPHRLDDGWILCITETYGLGNNLRSSEYLNKQSWLSQELYWRGTPKRISCLTEYTGWYGQRRLGEHTRIPTRIGHPPHLRLNAVLALKMLRLPILKQNSRPPKNCLRMTKFHPTPIISVWLEASRESETHRTYYSL